MIITIKPDLSSHAVSADGLTECFLPAWNPDTMIPFTSEAEVKAFAQSAAGRPFFFTPVMPLADLLRTKATICANRIDEAVANVVAKPQRFVKEYEEREAQARSFINEIEALPLGAAFPPAPPRIASFAKSAGLDDHTAGRLTIAQADALRSALGQLSDLRMRKYEVSRAASLAEMDEKLNEILEAINAIAATI